MGGGYTARMRNSRPRLILLRGVVGVAGTVNGEVTRVDIAKRDRGRHLRLRKDRRHDSLCRRSGQSTQPRHRRSRRREEERGRTRGIFRRPLYSAAARSGAVERRRARGGLESRAQKPVEHVQPRPRGARSVEGRRSGRRVPDAAGATRSSGSGGSSMCLGRAG